MPKRQGNLEFINADEIAKELNPEAMDHEKFNAGKIFRGHDIPKEDIIRRYYRSRKLFYEQYKAMADRWFLFFNADDEFEEVANFADGELTVLHEPYYNTFVGGLQ